MTDHKCCKHVDDDLEDLVLKHVDVEVKHRKLDHDNCHFVQSVCNNKSLSFIRFL